MGEVSPVNGEIVPMLFERTPAPKSVSPLTGYYAKASTMAFKDALGRIALDALPGSGS